MSYGRINTRASGKGVRCHYRAQLNRIRRTSVAESLEYIYQEESSNRHTPAFETFESTTRRGPQPEGMGQET